MLKLVEHFVWIFCCIFILVRSDDPVVITCTSGWTLSSSSGTCIQFVEETKTWSDARDACKAKGSDLVKIVDGFMNDLIADHISAQPPLTSYWIGLNDIKIENEFKWLDEDYLTSVYENWAEGQPNDMDAQGLGSGQDCAEIGLVSASEWNDIECSTLVRYICEKPADSSKLTCPSGWAVSSTTGTCIKFVEQNIYTWSDSREACKIEGADLVKIANNAINVLIAEYIIDQPGINSYWIGLHDNNQDRKFVWLDETSETSLEIWASGQPNNKDGNQGCVEIGLLSKSQWNDIECSFTAHPICEMPAGKKGTKGSPTTAPTATVKSSAGKVVKSTTTKSPDGKVVKTITTKPKSSQLIGNDGKETPLPETDTARGEGPGRSATIPLIVGLIVYIPVTLIVAYVFLTKYYKSLRKKKDKVLTDAVESVNDIIESDVMEMEKARAMARQEKGGEGSLQFKQGGY